MTFDELLNKVLKCKTNSEVNKLIDKYLETNKKENKNKVLKKENK